MKFEIYKSTDGWRWRLKAANGRIVATANESFERRAGALKGIQSVKKCSQAKVVEVYADVDKPVEDGADYESFEVYEPIDEQAENSIMGVQKPDFEPKRATALYDQKSVPRDDERDRY